MTDVKSAWTETAEQLTSLGSKLGAHYENQRGADGEQARAQTDAAIKRLGDAVQDAFDAVGAAAKDDAVREDVKQVGRSLVGALDVTFREVSSEIRKVFDQSSTKSPAAGTQDTPAQPPQSPDSPDSPDPESPQSQAPQTPQSPQDPDNPGIPRT